MKKVRVLVFTLIFVLTISMMGCTKLQKSKDTNHIQDIIQDRFEIFASYWCEFSKIPIETAEINLLDETGRVSFDGGEFVFSDSEYCINDELDYVDVIGNIQVVYYEKEGSVCGVEFISKSIVDFDQYVDSRYENLKETRINEDYIVSVGEDSVGLYQNVAGTGWTDLKNKTVQVGAAHGEGYVSVTSQFCDQYLTSEYKVCALEWLEGINEIVHEITLFGKEGSTNRGMRVGNTVEQLQNVYSKDLYSLGLNHPFGQGYVYLPKDGTSCYIVFATSDDIIESITLSAGYGGRPLELD